MNAKTLLFGLVLLAILAPACIVTTWAMDGEASPVDGEEPSAAPAPSVEVPLAAPSGEVVPSEAGERIVLRSGFKLEGRIVKRTETMLFLDVGYTILSVPGDEVRRIEPIVAAEESASESGVRSESDSIFYTADGLRSGPIDQKAREVAESVVKIECIGKSGSGFVIDDEAGYIVTNFHVIEGETDISIVLYTKTAKGLEKAKKEKVRIVAFNPYFDLALLKLEDREGVRLQRAYLGRYEDVRLGDSVFAIGSPLGLERTVSQGIVSNRNRAVDGLLYIQTTAAINPGNSGGALFNDKGEVVGVTNMKILGGESIGFAIPVHHLKDFLRNYQAFAYDKDNPNTGIRYLEPPRKIVPDLVTQGTEKAAEAPAPLSTDAR